MRAAMARAEVGDESKRRDPTVEALCERVADLLGQEAALFLPSGTMCNNIAAIIHCRQGDEIIAAKGSHVETSESGGLAVFAGARLRTVETADGTFGADDIGRLMRLSNGSRSPQITAIFAEQTHNRAGGTVWQSEKLAQVSRFARENQIAFHIDGARIMNAAVAHGVAASDFGTQADTVWMSFTKGLGCPVGSVLAGSKELVETAWEWKLRFGGGMRQAGILAAGCLYAIDNHVERLAEDHDNAKALAARIAEIDGLRLSYPAVETNMVFFELVNPAQQTSTVSAQLQELGIRLGLESTSQFRAVTHMDFMARHIDHVVDSLAKLVHA